MNIKKLKEEFLSSQEQITLDKFLMKNMKLYHHINDIFSSSYYACKFFYPNITEHEFIKLKIPTLVLYRSVFFFLCRCRGYILSDIAGKVKKNHATVLHSLNKVYDITPTSAKKIPSHNEFLNAVIDVLEILYKEYSYTTLKKELFLHANTWASFPMVDVIVIDKNNEGKYLSEVTNFNDVKKLIIKFEQ